MQTEGRTSEDQARRLPDDQRGLRGYKLIKALILGF